MKINKQQKGFTLIEVLISITIFVIFITSISTSYIYIARSQKRADDVRNIYSDMRYVVNLISEKARLGTVDYSCYSSNSIRFLDDLQGEQSSFYEQNSFLCSDLAVFGPDPEGKVKHLAIISSSGLERTLLKVDSLDGENKLLLYEEVLGFDRVWHAKEGYQNDTFREIPLEKVNLKNMIFQINPLTDPYKNENIACAPKQFQPLITIYSTIGNLDERNPFEFHLQTSVSSRVYNKPTDIPTSKI